MGFSVIVDTKITMHVHMLVSVGSWDVENDYSEDRKLYISKDINIKKDINSDDFLDEMYKSIENSWNTMMRSKGLLKSFIEKLKEYIDEI